MARAQAQIIVTGPAPACCRPILFRMETMFLTARGLLAILGLAVALVVPPSAPAPPAPSPAPAPYAVQLGPDEGMWPFDHPPLDVLREKHHFEPDQAWFDHLRLSTVRMQNGGSGAFVSAEGLVLTNHHLVMRSLQDASNQERDLLQHGFLATRRNAELKCEGLSVSILVESMDVTDTLRPAKDPAAAQRRMLRELRRADSQGNHEFRVQRLFGGERYVLHRSRRYTDVRLVWAPEMNVGFFGGNADNFTYPRFCLDVALLRVYENDKPVRPREHLRFDKEGAGLGELVLVSGHPAHTNRRQTLAQLVAARDHTYPTVISGLSARRRALQEFARQGTEQARAVRTHLWSIENSLKLIENRLSALGNERLIERKREAEHALLQTAEGRRVRDAFANVWSANKRYIESYVPRWLSRLPGQLAMRSRAVTAAAEATKAARLEEGESQAPCPTYIELLARTSVEKDLEEVLLGTSFQNALKILGPDHAVTKSMLEGRTAADQARRVVGGTRLHEPGFLRRAARANGSDGLKSLDDPMLDLHLRLDAATAHYRDIMSRSRRQEQEQLDRIEQARYRAHGGKVYPDADGTLRLSFGVVKGYTRGQRRVPAKTTIGGLFDRCDSFDGGEPYDLPARFLARRDMLTASTPLNFVCTADIANGNSGSPVVNRDNEVVGVVFDGNLESLGNSFVYDEEQARAVCVHSSAILEILEKVYGARGLVQELLGKR